ncbi:Ni/Fe-hydrogenase, b-type cytochrome subunit [Geobacter sp. SVR]|uniref:Ni/Fe-hydrogenase, b-type cytochrome subunit n=1 Tax=Geobacter sp. SVR TaxID=2495594 RepID=UPI00143EF5F7|nr:Ni/Fe-hydrogenase, b-type cytochrome subunit [Geobacter sp. SVR]BCS53495.1 Ni/Fe-hydrogenase, b-type cytochrome subunit [Geobacter sp. SVR]GCF85378.1 Ni/Fe-hydrogenase, b-type cytochrome subunit [Geobacter sp. SVR]
MHENKFKHYIWELPVRCCHWINVASIVTLVVTGFFIGTPFSFGSSASDYVMGWIRFVHFVAAYAFAVSVLSRLLWSFIGNRYARWREFLPFLTVKGREKMVKMLRYYMLIDRQVPETFGHNPMATTAYLVLFLLYLLMILTGFSLYAEHAPQGLMHKSLGFMYALFSSQGMRLAHHLGMWFILGFVVNHVYSAMLMDIKEHAGEISSIFSGYKFTYKKED